MIEKKIRLKGISDVREFVGAAEKCDFDVDIYYNHLEFDAKSIIAILSMDLRQCLVVKYNGQDARLENVLDKYAA